MPHHKMGEQKSLSAYKCQLLVPCDKSSLFYKRHSSNHWYSTIFLKAIPPFVFIANRSAIKTVVFKFQLFTCQARLVEQDSKVLCITIWKALKDKTKRERELPHCMLKLVEFTGSGVQLSASGQHDMSRAMLKYGAEALGDVNKKLRIKNSAH